MSNDRLARMRSDIRDRNIDDIAYNTKLTLLAVNSINALQELAKYSPNGHYDNLDSLQERMEEYSNEYAYILGYKNITEPPSGYPVDVTEIESEISIDNNIVDITPFGNARTEYNLGQADVMTEER